VLSKKAYLKRHYKIDHFENPSIKGICSKTVTLWLKHCLPSADLLFSSFFKACDNSKRKASQQLFCNLQTGTNLDKKSALIKILNWQ